MENITQLVKKAVKNALVRFIRQTDNQVKENREIIMSFNNYPV